MLRVRFTLCMIGIAIGVLLISTVTVRSDDNFNRGTPKWVLDIQARLQAFSSKAHAFSSKAHAFSSKAHAFSSKAHAINVTAQAYKCTLDIMNCQTLFRQIIVHYEDKIIKANNDDLQRNFPNLGSEFIDWHKKFKQNSTGPYVDAILKKYHRRYDPHLNDVVPINNSVRIVYEKKSYKDRRLLYWIAFFDGLERVRTKVEYPNSGNWSGKLAPDTDGTLKVWWILVNKFNTLGIHPINIARLINYEMEEANVQAHQPEFIEPAKLPALMGEFSKCLRNLIKHHSVSVVTPSPRTTPFVIEDMAVNIPEDFDDEKIMGWGD